MSVYSPISSSPSGFAGWLAQIRQHPVWLMVAVLFLLLAIFVPEQAADSFGFLVKALLSTSPYLLLFVIISSYATATGADGLIARVFQGNPVKMIIVAAVFGGLSPFCSCGVIPLIAALLTMGVPVAPVMAFWLASPVIDPAQFVLTSGLMGAEFALAKTLAAVGLGLTGGFVTHALVRSGYLTNVLKPGVGDGGCGGAKVRNYSAPVWAFWHDAQRRGKFVGALLKNGLFLLKWLTLAFLLESLMLAYVPADLIANWLGGSGVVPIALATVVGVPAYLNGYAALPLVSGLVEQGMAPGAGLAFLVAGGVTSMPAAIAVFALVRRPVFVLYLVLALLGSFASGLLFQMWLSV